MPELPEVETVRRIISREVAGCTISGVTYHDFPGVTDPMPPEAFTGLIIGRTIGEPQRRGKYLVLPLDDDAALVIHLRMTGRLLVTSTKAPNARFEHLAIHLEGDRDLRFADQRKFGRVVFLPVDAAWESLATLGPEPLDSRFTSAWLFERTRNRTAPIKAFLLDQRHVAGLGNIYVDEALHRSRIHPKTPAGTLDHTQTTSLVRSIRKVLRNAIKNQGTTFSNFENPYGERGKNAETLQVYGRAKNGLPCLRCGTPLAWIRVAGRGTNFCPRCQPPPDSAGNRPTDS